MINKVRAPLFDRLTDENPGQTQPAGLKTYNLQQLKDSIQREISSLLNTRSVRFPKVSDQEGKTVLDYGSPSFQEIQAVDNENKKDIIRQIKGIITVFEPRLQHVEIDWIREKSEKEYFSIHILISARLVIEEMAESVQFVMKVA